MLGIDGAKDSVKHYFLEGGLKKNTLVSACIFIDWNNVRKLFLSSASSDNSVNVRNIIFKIQEECASILKAKNTSCSYKVITRFYDGWHREDKPTSALLELEKVFNRWGFDRKIGSVYFSTDIRYGNELACESERNPLLSTSRDCGQKMIDTAIVCDFLYMLKMRHIEVGLIASDDDDFIPAALTAEAWGLTGYLVRSPGRTIQGVTTNFKDEPVKFWREIN